MSKRIDPLCVQPGPGSVKDTVRGGRARCAPSQQHAQCQANLSVASE